MYLEHLENVGKVKRAPVAPLDDTADLWSAVSRQDLRPDDSDVDPGSGDVDPESGPPPGAPTETGGRPDPHERADGTRRPAWLNLPVRRVHVPPADEQ